MIGRPRFGDLFVLERNPLVVDPIADYTQIGIKSFGRGIFHRAPCKGSELGKLKYYCVYPDRLIFSNIMAWEGAIARSMQSDEDTVGSQRFLSYRPIDDNANIDYVNYFFQSRAGAALVRQSSTGSVKRNQTLSPTSIEEFRVPLPSLDEQRRIVSKLDVALSQLPRVVNRGRAVELGLAQSLLDHSFEGEHEVPAADVVESMARPTEVIAGNSYQVAGVYSFGRGLFLRGWIDASETKYSTLFSVCEGDLVLSRLKAFEGAIAVADGFVDGCVVSQEFPTFRVNRSVCSTRYLHYLCRWSPFWARLARGSKGVGSRRERVSAEAFLATRIPLPSLARQEQILSVLDRGVGELGTLAARREQLLNVLRRSSLNAAFSSQL